MTADEIGRLSGEALRVAVAERVFGYKWQQADGGRRGWFANGALTERWTRSRQPDAPALLLPRYESDIAAAFEVVERMRERDYDFEYECANGEHHAKFGLDGDYSRGGMRGMCAAEAICRAALLAVADEDEG